MWRSMLYEIATTTVEGLERVINWHLWRWLEIGEHVRGTLVLIRAAGWKRLPEVLHTAPAIGPSRGGEVGRAEACVRRCHGHGF